MSELSVKQKQKVPTVGLLLIACLVGMFAILIISIVANMMGASEESVQMYLNIAVIVPFIVALSKAFEMSLKR